MGSYSPLPAPPMPDIPEIPFSKDEPQGGLKKVHTDADVSIDLDTEDNLTLWAEMKKAFTLAWPLTLFNVAGFSILVITLMFVGHLGELELSSASIATSFASVSCFTVMLGLASTLETLCGQAYGAKKYHLLGVYLQSAWIVAVAFGCLVLVLWSNMDAVLIAVGQDPEIARMAGEYLVYMIPGAFGAAILQPLVKYLQSQSVVMPLVYSALGAVLFHILNCQVLIYTLGYGFTGAALATTISYTSLTVVILLYTWASGHFTKTWTGFTWDAVYGLRLYLKLGIPSTFMMCFECWTVELLVLAAGLLPNPQLQLSLLAISLNTTNLVYNIPIGLSAAVSTRVSNELGAYRANAAKLAGKVVFGISITSACIIATSLVLARNAWGKAFSSVDEVVDSVATLMPLIALSHFLDGIQGVLSGIARGCGRQDFGAIINLLAFYIVGIPSGLFMGFVMHWSGTGLWCGLLLGQATQSLLLGLLVLTINWDNVADEALKRISTEPLLPTIVTGQ